MGPGDRLGSKDDAGAAVVRTGDRGWLIVAAAVLSVEATHDELLSQAVDRYLTRWPVATRMVIAYLAAHLLNLIPERVDPLTRMTAVLIRR